MTGVCTAPPWARPWGHTGMKSEISDLAHSQHHQHTGGRRAITCVSSAGRSYACGEALGSEGVNVVINGRGGKLAGCGATCPSRALGSCPALV